MDTVYVVAMIVVTVAEAVVVGVLAWNLPSSWRAMRSYEREVGAFTRSIDYRPMDDPISRLFDRLFRVPPQ
jgi:hypothetical protein